MGLHGDGARLAYPRVSTVDDVSEVVRRIRVLEVIDASACRLRTLRVFCSRSGRLIDVEGCRSCPSGGGVGPESVTCQMLSEPAGLGSNTPAALASEPYVTCARADVRAAALMSVIAPPWLVPIIDEGDRFVGFVSSSSLARSVWPSQALMSMRVRDFAFGSSLVVHETMTVREALHMMANRRTRSVALVDSDGKLRGMLSDIDALRAFGAMGPPESV